MTLGLKVPVLIRPLRHALNAEDEKQGIYKVTKNARPFQRRLGHAMLGDYCVAPHSQRIARRRFQ